MKNRVSKLVYKENELKKLREKLTEIDTIENIKIATAFISNSNEIKDFLKDLSMKVKSKENFEIYLSVDFSPNNKFEILSFLKNISNVYIIPNLHAKAYFITGKEKIFAFGSSNLTNNGFGNNLELMQIDENIDEKEVLGFFEYCKKSAILLTEDVKNDFKLMDDISNKIENNQEIKELHSKIRELKEKFIVEKSNNKYEYGDLTDYYFTEEDYETFNKINSKKNNKEINEKRNVVKDKFLNLNEEIIEELQEKYNLYNHWRKTNIIAPSGARPSIWNNFSLEWLGVRYLRKEIEEIVSFMKKTSDDEEDFGANKFTCFQINISYEYNMPYFEIGIFHSVPSLAYDREKVIENLENNRNNIRQNFETVFENLKGHNLKFNSYNKETSFSSEFDVDLENSKDFCNWYLENVKDKCYSSIMFKYAPNDIRIKTKNNIKNLVLKNIELLNPLYNLLIGK